MDSLDSGLSIAELKFELPVVTTTACAHYRGIEEHVENDNHEICGDPRNTGRRLQGEAKTKSLLWPHSIGIRGATLLKYKKGLKRPTLAWNEMPFVTPIQYILPMPHLDLYKNSLAFSGPSVWNTLPVAIKTVGTIGRFKSELHKHLMTD